jgi:hypothetical protein
MNQPNGITRRAWLASAGTGFGSLALSSMQLQADVRQPHHPAKAKAVIWLFCDGGASHLDTFDPKPALAKYDGKPLPGSFKKPMTSMGATAHTPLMASKRKFKPAGKAGIPISDWFPEISKQCADDLCVLRNTVADGLTHVQSVLQMNTCSLLPGRPHLGSWATYGLGSVSENLPGFVILTDTAGDPPGGASVWSNGFLPAAFQGTRFSNSANPILYAESPAGFSMNRQRNKVDFIKQLNQNFAAKITNRDPIDASIGAYELAFRMQSSAPEVADFSRETEATKQLYGMDRPETEKNARNCLLARRLVERGVRFIQIYLGVGSRWDAHSNLEGNHSELCNACDKPWAGLIQDLKQRGLLDSTLVIWGGEFGRTPMSESGDGRDHNPYGFSIVLAGGGVKPGFIHGETDEIGLYAVNGRSHVRDVHATILHLMGIKDEKLRFLTNGREEFPTAIGGKLIKPILA